MSAGVVASIARPRRDTPQPSTSLTPDTVPARMTQSHTARSPSDGSRRRTAPDSFALNAYTPSSPPKAAVSKDNKLEGERSASKENDKNRDKERETRLPACEACRIRKVKCDALLPACTPCQKSGRECFGRDKVPNVSRGLVYELQQKVKDLESRLALATSATAAGSPLVSQNADGGEKTAAKVGRPSHGGKPPAKRTKRGRNGYQSFEDGEKSADTDEESSTSDSLSSTPEPTGPSPNDFIQQTSTILESLSSDLTGSSHRPPQPTMTRPTTQALDNDEASALAALTKHHKDRARSPHRLKRRSSSNASRYRDEVNSYFASSSRFRDAYAAFPYKSRSRPGRNGLISAYDRTFFDKLIARYLTYMNTALPVINEARLWEMAAAVYQDDERLRAAALSTSPYDAMPPPPNPLLSAGDRVTLSKHRYVVLMVLAIALASLGRSQNFSPDLRRLGHHYWAEAQALFPVLFRFGDLDKLRATLLQLQYALLVPTAGSVWELSGTAVRLVTELNLHVDREYDSAANAPFSQENVDLRRRLFWTTYCLDRSLAVALARPPGLSDAWIHVQLPSLLSDAELLRTNVDAGSSVEDNSRVDAQKQLFRSHINLRRIQSEILCRLHSVNPRDYSLDNDGVSLSQPGPSRPSLALVMEVGPPTPNVEWQSRMMAKLVEWRSAYDRIRLTTPAGDRPQGEGVSSTAMPFITRDWIDLTHNLTVSLLFRPSPNNPRPDSHGLQQAFMASGRAMKIYKSMHRNSAINFPWLATHHLFISGLTHLNALEKLTRTGFSCPSPVVEVVFNVQSCASTLEALTSRDDGYGTRIRDTFDAAASAVLSSVLEPGFARQSSSSSTAVLPHESSAADITSVEEFIRGSAATSLNGRQGEQNRSASMLEGSSLRRSSHHEAMLHAAHQQHPTWLSDSTWNSLNTLDAAPPPGSTIFVAAPPRTARFGTPGHSLVPTLSERTTQSVQNGAGMHHAAMLQGSVPPSPRGFGLQSYASSLTPTSMNYTGSHGISEAGASDPFQVTSNVNNAVDAGFDSSGRPHKDASTTSNGSVEQAAAVEQPRSASSTFGFHNWLLQPYEGGADGLGLGGALSNLGNSSNAFSASSAALLFGSAASSSPSTSASADPFQHMHSVSDPMLAARGAVGGQYPSPSSSKGMGNGGAETDASTLLDFLSMLPATATTTATPDRGHAASPSTKQAKQHKV